jgi:predicted secreted hydrolase
MLVPAAARAGEAAFAPVVPGRVLRFPEDEGSHPEFRTEWWYITGWLNAAAAPLGFQITFFRTRPHPDSGNPSRFDPRHILIGHAALSDPRHGRLRHAQRLARAGFGLAEARTGVMDVRLDDWHLVTGDGHYAARIAAEGVGLDLRFTPTQPPLLQGMNGYSRKGPRPESASYYYSLPQLAVAGSVRPGKEAVAVSGVAWLDHEWSSEYMDPNAVGWDWIGINLDDGGALMAFRMRGRDGSQFWAGATIRARNEAPRTFGPEAIEWSALRWWRSPRTGARYPVAMRVGVGELVVELEPMFDDQENDTRLSTGAVYWEGAVLARRGGSLIGRGYLELTGYAGKLRM